MVQDQARALRLNFQTPWRAPGHVASGFGGRALLDSLVLGDREGLLGRSRWLLYTGGSSVLRKWL